MKEKSIHDSAMSHSSSSSASSVDEEEDSGEEDTYRGEGNCLKVEEKDAKNVDGSKSIGIDGSSSSVSSTSEASQLDINADTDTNSSLKSNSDLDSNSNSDSNSDSDSDSSDSSSSSSQSSSKSHEKSTLRNESKHRKEFYRSIADELELVRGLEQQHGDDLAVQLYGTDRLKRYLNRKRRWTQKGINSDDHLKGENSGSEGRKNKGKIFRERQFPPRRWSAWPLPPELVPAMDEQFGVPDDNVDGLAAWTTRGPRETSPRGVMVEVLTAVAQRMAKERLRMEQQKLRLGLRGSGVKFAGGEETRKSEEDRPVDIYSKRSSKSQQRAEKYDISRLAMKADDAESFAILQPKIDSLLSNFDNLLLALHDSRRGHRIKDRRKITNTNTRKKNNELQSKNISNHDSKQRDENLEPADTRSVATASKQPQDKSKTGRGRPLVYEKPRKGESYYMMRKRLSLSRGRASDNDDDDDRKDRYTSRRKSKSSRSVTTSPASTQSSSVSSALSESDHRSNRRRDDTSEGFARPPRQRSLARRETSHSREYNRQLRSWRDILDVAWKAGWDNESIERTAERCKILLGNGSK